MTSVSISLFKLPVVNFCLSGCVANLVHPSVQSPVPNVHSNRVVKEGRVLWYNANRFPQRFLGHKSIEGKNISKEWLVSFPPSNELHWPKNSYFDLVRRNKKVSQVHFTLCFGCQRTLRPLLGRRNGKEVSSESSETRREEMLSQKKCSPFHLLR